MQETKIQKAQDKQKNTAENIAISLSTTEIVGRHGSAIKEFDVAYSGIDNETGQVFKGLKAIAESKVNPEYQDVNIKQQAGYSAEVLEVAKENAESAIKKTGKRAVLADELGKPKDQFKDIVIKDSKGRVIEQTQMKFVGKNGKECADNILSKKCEKYLYSSDEVGTIGIPKDFYNDAKQALKTKEDSLTKKIQTPQERGETHKAQELEERLKKVQKAQEKLKPSQSTSEEAIKARKNPEIEILKYELETANKAGVQGVKIGASIGGGISVITNTFAVFKGDKEIGEAIIDVGKDTTKAAVVGYGSAAAGSLIKGTLQNASNESLRAISKTNAPAMVITVALETSKTLHSYLKGEIDGVECAQELGEKGCGMLASSAFAVVFQIALPVPVVGAMIGGMIGYSLSTMYYKEILAIFASAKLARQERIRIERECEEAIRAIQAYRKHFEILAEQYLKEHRDVFNTALADMHQAMQIGDIETFIESNNAIIRQLGKEVRFGSFAAIDACMSDKNAVLRF